MTHDEIVKLGQTLACNQIKMYEREIGLTEASAMAGGVARGAGLWIAAHFGTREAYNFLAGLADGFLLAELPEDQASKTTN